MKRKYKWKNGRPGGPKNTNMPNLNKVQCPDHIVEEYRSLGLLNQAADTKAAKNLKIFAKTLKAAKRFGLQLPISEVHKEPNPALRSYRWYSKSKKRSMKFSEMDWTHLLNCFGIMMRALAVENEFAVSADEFSLVKPFLEIIIGHATIQAIAYEICWRQQFGHLENSKLIMTHAEYMERYSTLSDDFFYERDEK
jgi:hypothetical protein